MKKLLLPLFIILGLSSFSQNNNSWIDYSKAYYKFRVGANGLYRINQSTLSTLGLANTPAQQFQLWRNGEEVRLYTSAQTGPILPGGYIEFWGLMNDGKKDTKLYKVPEYQLSDAWSLETDTAAYFLTVNPAGSNLRYNNTANNVSGTTLTPEAYFMNRIGLDYKDKISSGYAAVVGYYVYSSSYDPGEGYSSNDIYPGFDLGGVLPNINLYPQGPTASMEIAAAGNALNSRNVVVKFFTTPIMDTSMNYFGYIHSTVNNIPLSNFLSPDFLTFSVTNNCSVVTDRMVVSSFHVRYPSKFNFNNKKNFYFELPASLSGNYLIIDNFNTGGTAPVLLDLNTGNRYTGDISTAGKVKFVVLPSADPVRKFMLVSEDATNITSINGIAPRSFVNLGTTANQGNYMIISNPALYNNGSGINYVDQYRAYRSSIAGGSFNAKVYDIDQLTDQFGYGIKNHPLAIKDFVQYSRAHFIDSPKYVFIIGKGVSYDEYKPNESNPKVSLLNLVQTFGYPASDMSLSSDYNSFIPKVPIGRLSAINGAEVGIYLAKMKEYELAQASPSQTVDDKAWMKKGVHISGGSDSIETATFVYYLDSYKAMMQDTLFGADVETFQKSDVAAIQIAASQRITDLFNSGIGYIQYFGHSSANSLAFNLNNPETYNNQGKYPFFSVSGCTAGNIFAYDSTRLAGNLNLSEKYLLTDHKGSIAFLASTHLGIPPFLNNYDYDLFDKISHADYGKSAGIQIRDVIKDLAPDGYVPDYFTRMNLEEITLHGDPALRINSFNKPDFVIEQPMVKLNPAIVSVADNNFSIQIQMRNIGKAVGDSIRVIVKRQLPTGTILTLYNQKRPAIRNTDSLNLISVINPVTDKGLNHIIITLDADNAVDELSETNNSVTKDFYIFEDEVRPVYPYNYSIVNQPNITFYGSTANPLIGSRQVQMEIDTTELFNSPFKKNYTSNSVGGLIQVTPTIAYNDSVVYYWRIGMTPITGAMIWNGASFIYLPASSKGFNSSHYYQNQKGVFDNINYTSNRSFEFAQQPVNITTSTANYPPNLTDNAFINVGPLNVSSWGNHFGTLQFVALNPRTLDAFPNGIVNATEGRFQSVTPGTTSRQKQFEYYFTNITERNKAMRFLDSIPNGYYVFVYNLLYNAVTYNYVNAWQGDAAINGNGQSLYAKLQQLGFSKLDSFNRNVPFMFTYKKGDPTFAPIQTIGNLSSDILANSLIFQQYNTTGSITSPVYGPAKAWTLLHWRGKDLEPNAPDVNYVEVYGIDSSGTNTLLKTITQTRDTSLSFVNANVYRYLKLRLVTRDTVNATPQQLSYFRVNADYLPEGAVEPNVLLRMKDTVEVGEKIDFALAFKNVSETAFDSLKVKFIITDKSNVPHIILLPKKKPLASGDSIVVSYTIDTKNYAGMNTLFVEVNPDNDQAEEFHFNNFIYKNFYVKPDVYNPLLDVTFDGVHILNRDIVSARPHITIKLKDESKFLALNDTSLLKVQIRYPGVNGVLKTYQFDNDTLRFTPANLASGDNTAKIDLTPLLPGNDDEYQLIVSGKDVSGNAAGALGYTISFKVISKPMISNFLNYPNPFTTSTAFVFTITGTDVPQNIRIQVLTITGKIVREITKDELGPLHIGRNITEFKWDGTDSYGQKLANGVYLYRVLTNLNGKSLEKFKAEGDNTDKYFTKGYGKMYLMR